MKRFTPLTATAIMSALSVILTRFASFRVPMGGAEGIRIGFGGLPNILAGIVFGPMYGGLSAAIADVAGMIISPMGQFMPQFTLAAALGGALPGLAFRVLKRGKKEPGLFVFGISIAVGVISISCGLTPYFINSIFGLPLKVILPPRILSAFVEIPLYAYLCKTIYHRLRVFFPLVS